MRHLILMVCLAGQSLYAADWKDEHFSGLQARAIGPAGMSGRVTDIQAVHEDPRFIYLGAASGGVWKSTNGGQTFVPIFEGQPVHSIGALAIFQASPQIVWAGTGEGNTRNSASYGNGVYRSLDGGKTWAHLGLDHTERISRIVLHPTDPEIAYVASPGHMWGDNPNRGLFKTTDGGKTWNKILFVDEKTGCGDVIMDPENPNKLFASMWQFRREPWFFKSGGPGSGLYVTHDGGVNWQEMTPEQGIPKGELGRSGFAIAPSDPNIVYALVEAKANTIIRSEDGGQHWETVHTKPYTGGRPFYFSNIRVDPERPNRIYRLQTRLTVSDDGGRNFRVLEGAGWGQVHVDHHAMWINPSNGKHILLGGDGGVTESLDRGLHFRYFANIPLAQIYHLALDMETPYNVYFGLQDNGSWRGPSNVKRRGGIRNHEWKFLGVGDGFETLPDPDNVNAGFSIAQGGVLMRWDLESGALDFLQPAPPESGEALRFNWSAAMAFDPHEAHTLLYGSQFVHRTRDYGATWEIISPDLTSDREQWQNQEESGGLTPDVTGAENFTSLVAIAPSALEKGLIWTGSDDGRVHITRDGGKNWASQEKRMKGLPPHSWVTHIEPSPLKGGTALVTFDRHRYSDMEPYLYRTDDYGKTWVRLNTTGVKGYALVIRQDPVKEDLLYLGTETGLYLSPDNGKNWMQWTQGFSNVSAMDLAIHPRDHDLVVGTHGRGVFIVDDIRPLRNLNGETMAKPLHLFPIADTQQHLIAFPDGGMAQGASEYRGQARPYGALITFWANPETAKLTPHAAIEISDKSGRVVKTIKPSVKPGLNRVVWDLRTEPYKLPEGADANPFIEPIHPEMIPGEYSVKATLGKYKEATPVRILQDPTCDHTPEDWAKRLEALEVLATINDKAVATANRLTQLKRDIEVVNRKVMASSTKEDQAPNPLLKMGEELEAKLREQEKTLWITPATKGIVAETDIFSRIGRINYFLLSSWLVPTPTHHIYMDQLDKQLKQFLEAFNNLLAGEGAAYRKEVEAQGIRLLDL